MFAYGGQLKGRHSHLHNFTRGSGDVVVGSPPRVMPDAAGDGQPLDEKALREFKRSHRQMRRNWDLPSKFPDIRVIDAYRKVYTLMSASPVLIVQITFWMLLMPST